MMVKEEEFTYCLVESLSTAQGAFGEAVYGVQGRYYVNGQEKVCTVADISANREIVEKLVQTLQRLQPTPEILTELVEDYLEETYTLDR